MRSSAVLLLALAVLLAACSGGADEDTEVQGVALERDDQGDPTDAGEGAGDGTDPDEVAQLGEVSSQLGDFLGFGDEDVELGGTGPIDADAGARLVADVVEAGDGQVRCQVTLEAPPDQPLDVRGRLRVDLLEQDRAGVTERTPQQLIEVDVELDAGQHHELPLSDPVRIEPDRLAGVWCEARHEPR